VCGGVLIFISSCSSFNYEKGGTILGTIGGTGSGMYMCQNYGMGNFTIGCMVLGGLMGGVLGGQLGETFDNKEIYNSVQWGQPGDVYNYENKDKKMDLEITDYYMKDEKGLINNYQVECKDFEFELHEDGSFKKGKGTSCKDEFGKWRTQGIDLLD